MRRFAVLPLALALLVPGAPLAARDSLGIFGDWGSFRDPEVPRCYAIALNEQHHGKNNAQGFTSIGTWPKRQIGGQIHIRLSRPLASKSRIRLSVGNHRFTLTGNGTDAWAQDKAMDAAITAAMRSASAMSVTAVSDQGRHFTDRYSLAGVASAMDAATLACAKQR
ncbi:hypothetical protein D6851_12040 [Altericroceibacterium spongiae]|uniref:Uncharacterized protein n=2 Tax=Altericroceibacterium spongiae TaxID=2320269 RepID=A0A420EET6_9SPHN|nr:hypothetical protein D6851_12040 [Altericroceibacterium spongiae]